MKTISLKVDPFVDDELTRLARKRGASKSELVREAIQTLLQKRKEPQAASCLDLAGDLVGRVAGPSDLSSNSAYLEGFGE